MSEETEKKKEWEKCGEECSEYSAGDMYYFSYLLFVYSCRAGKDSWCTTRLPLQMIHSSIEDLGYVEDGSEYSVLRELAASFMIFKSLEDGEDCTDDDIERRFAPFGYAPEEFLVFFRKTGDGSTAVRRYLSGVVNFVDSLSSFPERLRSVTVEYLGRWLCGFIAVIGPYYDEIRGDGNPGKLFSFIIGEPTVLYDAMTKMFAVFGCHIREIEEAYTSDAYYSFLNTAVRSDNEPCFERLLKSGTLSEKSIVSYPSGNMKILKKLFELGILLPGTEEGRAAFFNLVSETDPAEEIITAVLHPSYFECGGKTEMTPLVAAIRNCNFPPEKYHLLVRDRDDVNRADGDGITPLGYAIATGKREKVKEVLKLGAHMFFRDRDGRNIPYILLEREKGRPEDIIYASPDTLLTDYSSEGLLPIHSILDNNSSARWLEKFRKTDCVITRGKALWFPDEEDDESGKVEISEEDSSASSAC